MDLWNIEVTSTTSKWCFRRFFCDVSDDFYSVTFK